VTGSKGKRNKPTPAAPARDAREKATSDPDREPRNADPKAPRDPRVWSGLDVRRASAKGLGLFSTTLIAEGQPIATVEGTVMVFDYDEEPGWGETWFGVAPGKWIEPHPNSPPAFVNHSCEPNAQVRDGTRILALRTIHPGEEITIDYALTEEDPHWTMPCSCGSRRCVRLVRGAAKFAQPPTAKTASRTRAR